MGKREKIILRGSSFFAQLIGIIDSCGFAPNPTFFFALMQKRSRLYLLINPIAACSLKDK